ncbi:MAG: SGNH/GDSL hydrolase family protein [Clostridia bacterium]|nr:SGNH/GDSL hydrolase family protein [Clostridia bacterium]
MKTLKKIEKFDKNLIEDLLVPVWSNTKIINETGLVIGKEGFVRLLSTPVSGTVRVTNIFQDVLYEEGIDYIIQNNTIKRVPSGNLPYFEVDEYFRKKPNAQIILKANPENIEFSFPEQRYIYFSEGVDGFNKYVSISYQVDKALCKDLIVGDKRLQAFVETLKETKSANLLLYGDSITVGCNATGTVYGGNVSPYLPDWNTLVKLYLEKKYSAEIKVSNQAVGGWSTIEAVDNFEQKCGETLPTTDLFCIGFGANDISTDIAQYKQRIKFLIDGYLQANPNGNVLLYSTLLPNNQAIGWRTNHALFEQVLLDVATEYERVGVAKISTVFLWLEAQGKPTRDLLANSINHPNDFGVRVYAQTLLKTLLGEEFL